MTLCMAALCVAENGNAHAVVAADRMVTYGGFIEFEHTVPKMAHPAPFAVALIAGDTLIGTRLATMVAAEFKGANPRVADIAERTASRYLEMRSMLIESQILCPRGLDLGSFYGNHASLNPQVTMMLDQQMAQFNPDIELLVAGVDDEGAHIYSIHNPGKPEREHDFIGYSAIGSGGIHALQAMIGFRHSPTADLRETIFRVYAAKRRAEVAPGVGVDTDMALVSASGVTFLEGKAIQQLASMYENYGMAAERAQTEELGKLHLGEDGAAQDGET